MALDADIVRNTIAEIEEAFAELTPPNDAQLLHPQCMDSGDVADFLGGFARERLTDEMFIGNYAAPSFFSAKAFQYYMPAFMIWSLKHYDTIEYTPESTVRAFDPTSSEPGLYEFQRSKYELFTERQRTAVIRFLETLLPDRDLGPIAKEALENYWLRESIL